MSLRTDMARARGLGAAKDGVGHWWIQRLTALALVPLALWFVASIVALAGSGYNTAADWIGEPVPAVLLILLLGIAFHHAQLGLQVVIEDYVHTGWLKLTAIVLVKFLAVLLTVATVFAVLKIAFIG